MYCATGAVDKCKMFHYLHTKRILFLTCQICLQILRWAVVSRLYLPLYLRLMLSHFPVKPEGGVVQPQCGVPQVLPRSPGSSDGQWWFCCSSTSSPDGPTGGARTVTVSEFVAGGAGGSAMWVRVPVPGSACCKCAAFPADRLQVQFVFLHSVCCRVSY